VLGDDGEGEREKGVGEFEKVKERRAELGIFERIKK